MARPLVVVATAVEAAHLPAGVDVVVCGIGKVEAAIAATEAVVRLEPSVVVSLGTAGGLTPYAHGLFVPSRVLNHDLSAAALRQIGYPAVDEIAIAGGDGSTLATGDLFVTDVAVRDALAERADVVDMEGFAVAAVAQRFAVPFRAVKHVSDHADDSALDWPQVVDASARALGAWVAENVLT